VGDFVGDLALLRAAKGDHDDVLRLALRALAIHEKSFGRGEPRVINDLYFLARASGAKGDSDQSLNYWSDLFGAIRQFHPSRSLELEDAGALESMSRGWTYTEIYETLCSELAESQGGRAWVVGATHLALDKALLEEIRAAESAAESDPQRATQELRERYQDIKRRLSRLSEMNLYETERNAKWRELQSQLNEAESKMAERVGLLEQMLRERNLTLPDIARGLPPQSALVDLIQYRQYDFHTKTNQWKEPRYAAYLTFPLARDSTNVSVERVDLGEAAPINECIAQFYQLLADKRIAPKRIEPVLQRLSELVYAPLARHLTNVSHLIICPDGQLSRVPFEMLRVGDRFLIEEQTISYVTSGREIVRLANPTSPRSNVQSPKSLVMGAPDFDLDLSKAGSASFQLAGSAGIPARSSADANQDALPLAGRMPALRSLSRDYRGITFKPLLFAEPEARSVAKLLGGDCVLRVGPEAREAELKAAVSPRVLHLATHGFFLSDQDFKRTNALRDSWIGNSGTRWNASLPKDEWENPMVRCGIALAGANHAGQITNAVAEDGVLTGLEASLLNLQGTELVILSACDTGKGEVRIGEGVMSLRRAFRIAGAQTVLASQWPVNDKATSQLMTEFIRRWRSGEPRAKAWREAQLSLLHSKEFASPYFWAAFTLTGQWN
jgi:CHAT domain-containing protein